MRESKIGPDGYIYDSRTNVTINTNEKDLLMYKRQVQDAMAYDRLKTDFGDLLRRVMDLEKKTNTEG